MKPDENNNFDCDSCDCESPGTYTFGELFTEFIAGTPIKRRAWRGYWRYRFGKIEMHSKDGSVTNFTDTNDIIFTLSGILQNDWERAYNYNCDIPVK